MSCTILYFIFVVTNTAASTCRGERFRRETSTLWPEKFNTDDVNRCSHKLSSGHGVSDLNFVRAFVSSYRLSYNFEFCYKSAKVKNLMKSKCIPRKKVSLGVAPFTFDLSLWPFITCLSFVNNSWKSVSLRQPIRAPDQILARSTSPV